jgi:hypothetical protein
MISIEIVTSDLICEDNLVIIIFSMKSVNFESDASWSSLDSVSTIFILRVVSKTIVVRAEIIFWKLQFYKNCDLRERAESSSCVFHPSRANIRHVIERASNFEAIFEELLISWLNSSNDNSNRNKAKNAVDETAE